MNTLTRLLPTMLAGIALLPGADLAREKFQVGDRHVPVSAKKDLTIKARQDQDVKNRELWYAKYDGNSWGAWQKHGIDFARDAAITWAPTEGHWKIYVRIQEVSGLSQPQPTADTKATEFIIDRTPPAAAITFPANGAKLRGGQKYTVTWTVSDQHLHRSGITLKWARDNDDEPIVVARNVPNTGKFDWTTPLDMTANGQLMLEAADKALNIGTTASTGIIVDAIAPSRNILGPAITASQQVDLAIRAQDAGPAGMAKVQLYYSLDNGATWSSGPSVEKGFETIAWKAPDDGKYLLSLLATDQSGNANPIPKTAKDAQGSILIDTKQPIVTLASPVGVEEPARKANAPIRRIFKPNDTVHVKFDVKDANPRPDGVTVYLQTEASGRWEILGKGLAPDKPYSFSLPDISTSSARIKVSAVDVAGNKTETMATEAFRIDNKVEGGSTEVDL